MIGMEGLVGVSALFGAEVSSQNVIIQIPVTALRMNTARCLDAFNQRAEVRKVLLRFADTLFNLSAQTAACNRLHSIEQRLARWMLECRDRLDGDDLCGLTHDNIAQMLGVRRAGVSETAVRFQERGLIEYGRKKLRIIDRAGVENASCECFRAIREEYDRLLDPMISRNGQSKGSKRH